MESIWQSGMDHFALFRFELLVMAACALASTSLIALWKYREVRGIKETALKILLSVSLGLGIVVVSSALTNVPGWLFLFNVIAASVIGYTVVATFPGVSQLIPTPRKRHTGSHAAEKQSGPVNAVRLQSVLPEPRKTISADPSDPGGGDVPLTGITHLRKLRAIRHNA